MVAFQIKTLSDSNMVVNAGRDMVITGLTHFDSFRLLRTGMGGRDSPTHLLRKEVIHPHLPVGIPCYDLVLIADLTVVVLLSCELKSSTSGVANFAGLTGSVYKERERIHRNLLICDYYRFRLHEGELQPSI
jgi:hypothetical protein